MLLRHWTTYYWVDFNDDDELLSALQDFVIEEHDQHVLCIASSSIPTSDRRRALIRRLGKTSMTAQDELKEIERAGLNLLPGQEEGRVN
jgi:hypothetical protein